jgi:hypothetical protein
MSGDDDDEPGDADGEVDRARKIQKLDVKEEGNPSLELSGSTSKKRRQRAKLTHLGCTWAVRVNYDKDEDTWRISTKDNLCCFVHAGACKPSPQNYKVRNQLRGRASNLEMMHFSAHRTFTT